MERALIAEYERDMDAAQAALDPGHPRHRARARRAAAGDPRLRPRQGARGRGGRRAARAELLAAFAAGGAPRLHAAE